HKKDCINSGVAVNTEDCFLASIGESQDFLIQLVTRAAPTDDDDAELWSTYFRRLGVGFWANSLTQLRSTVLDLLLKRSLAKYRRTKELPVIEGESALWLALLGRQKVLASLYKQHGQLTSDPKALRVASFLAMDFTTPENKRLGAKNAFELVRQKRHSMAAAVFLLIGDVRSAVNVATRYLEDVQLAILFIRCGDADGGITKECLDDLFVDTSFDNWVGLWRLWSSHDYPELARRLAVAGSEDLSVAGSEPIDRDPSLGVLPTPPHLSTCSTRDIFEYLCSAVPAFGAQAEGLVVEDTPKSVVATRLLGRGLAALLPPVAEESALTSAVHWARRASILFDEVLTPRKAPKMPSCIPGEATEPPVGSDLQSCWIRRVRGALLDPRLNPMPPAPELWSILSRLVHTSNGGMLPSWAAELTSMVLAGIGDWSTSVPEVQEAAAAVVLSELERLLLEHEAAATGPSEETQADKSRITLAEHYTGVLFELLQPNSSPQVAVAAEAPPLTCLTEAPGGHSMRLRSLVVCSLVLERVLSPPKGSPKLTVYERQYQLLVRWHLKTHVYEAMLEPEAVHAGQADEPNREHPLETILAAPRRLRLLQSTCPAYRRTPEQESEHLPKSLHLSGIMSQLGWHSITGLCLDRSAGASLRLAVSAGHETGLVKVIDLPQLIRTSVGFRDGVTPEEYYREDSQWRMDIERSVMNSNTNLPAGTKIVPSERTRFIMGAAEPPKNTRLGSALPLRPGCRMYASDVMLLSLGISWVSGNNGVSMFDRFNNSTALSQSSVCNSLTAHPTASVFASATNSGVRVCSFGCPAIDEPAQELCAFESSQRPSLRDALRVASWSGNGETLAAIGKRGHLSVWSARRPGKPIISFDSPFIRGNDVKALTPSGSLMLICGRETPDGSGGAAMVDCRSPELVVQKWNAGPGLEYTCASGLSQPQELQLGTCDGRVVDLDTRAGGRSKTVMLYPGVHDRSPAIHSLLRYGPDQDGIVAVTHGSAVGVLQAGKDAGSFDSEYTMHKGGMKSAMQAAFSKIGPKLVAAADACGTVSFAASGMEDEAFLEADAAE
ncbi:regulator of (H+)-ATPase in vacuolar membrane, partial [Perkinsus olseni]